jgi:cytochrome P450
VATVVFMATEPTEETRHLSEAFVASVRGGTALIRRPIPGGRLGAWNAGLRGREILEQYFREQLPAKRASEDHDLFAALCHIESEDGHRFSDDDVVNHMIFLMMAAHDTSTITATAMASFLAVHPEWQERCREEARSVPTLDFASIDKLESLDLVFQEAMRLVSPVPAFVRRTTKDTVVGGHHLPAGVIVNVLPGTAHRLPDRWAAVTEFEPERFAEPRLEQKSHRFASMPFGGGAHKCIGMAFGAAEVKAILHRILLDYRIEVDPGFQNRWDHTSLPKPLDGLPVVLRKL